MQIFKNTLTINFISYTFFTTIASSIILVSSIIVLLINGLNLTVEFTGGTNINISMD